VSLVPLLDDPHGSLGREALYFHYPHYYHVPATTPVGALRAGEWKLLEHFETGRLQLFNLRTDLGEMVDLAGKEPDLTAQLHRKLQAWRREIGAEMGRPNRAYSQP
jgi:hypothetical protein